jgi:hypothetical protein
VKVRRFITVLAITSILFFSLFLILREPATHPPLPIAFAGWTNIAGVDHAALIFPLPPIHRPKHNFVLKRTFRFEVDLSYLHENGATTVSSIENTFGSGFPFGPTQILVPVAAGVRSVSIVRAEGILGGYWDNSILGWKPPSPPREKRWTFTFPGVLKPKQSTRESKKV